MRPVNSNYSNMATHSKKTFSFSDSIAKPIHMNEFNHDFRGGQAFKQSFPGVTASKLKHYVKPWLIEDKPDRVSWYKQYY